MSLDDMLSIIFLDSGGVNGNHVLNGRCPLSLFPLVHMLVLKISPFALTKLAPATQAMDEQIPTTSLFL